MPTRRAARFEAAVISGVGLGPGLCVAVGEGLGDGEGLGEPLGEGLGAPVGDTEGDAEAAKYRSGDGPSAGAAGPVAWDGGVACTRNAAAAAADKTSSAAVSRIVGLDRLLMHPPVGVRGLLRPYKTTSTVAVRHARSDTCVPTRAVRHVRTDTGAVG